jgi:hypothetical protein
VGSFLLRSYNSVAQHRRPGGGVAPRDSDGLALVLALTAARSGEGEADIDGVDGDGKGGSTGRGLLSADAPASSKGLLMSARGPAPAQALPLTSPSPSPHPTVLPTVHLVLSLASLSWVAILGVTSVWQGAAGALYPSTWDSKYEAECPDADPADARATRSTHFPVFEGQLLLAASASQLLVGLLGLASGLVLCVGILRPWWRTGRGGGGGGGGGSSGPGESADRDVSLAVVRTDTLRWLARLLQRVWVLHFTASCALLAPALMNLVAASSLSPELASWFVLPSSRVPLAGGARGLCGPPEGDACWYRFTPEGLAALLGVGGRLGYALHAAAAALALSDVGTLVCAVAGVELRETVRGIALGAVSAGGEGEGGGGQGNEVRS